MSDLNGIKQRVNLIEYCQRRGITVKPDGKASCPFHPPDKNESFGIFQGKDMVWRWKDFHDNATGTIIDLLARLENISDNEACRILIEEFGDINGQPARQKATPEPQRKKSTDSTPPWDRPGPGETLEAEYGYTDEEGRILYFKRRFKPKDFDSYRIDGENKVYKLENTRRVLYRLHKLVPASSAWLVEGEKDVHTLEDLGLVATTGGGVQNWKDEFIECFKGKKVIVCLDVGVEDTARKRAQAISKVAASTHLITLKTQAGLEDKQDITDFVQGLKVTSKEERATEVTNLLLGAENLTPATADQIADCALTAPQPADPSLPEIDNNFLNLYIDSVSRVTDAPKSFILFSAIGMLSGILNRHWFSYPRRINLNLYMLLLAASTVSRKSVVLDIVNDYLNEVEGKLVLPESFTPEALLTFLSKQCCGLIIWRELIQVGGFAFGSEYNKALPSLLTDLYDSKSHFRRITKGEDPFDIKDSSISILAAGIQTWLISMMTGRENEFYGGLWTRFLMISAPEQVSKKFHLPKRLVLVPEIIGCLKNLHELEAKEIFLNPILPLHESWGQKHLEEALKIERPEMQASFRRFEVALVKIAAILQLADAPESTTIEPHAYLEATKLIEFLKAQLPDFFEQHVHFGEFGKNRAAILRLLKNRGRLMKGEITRFSRMQAKVAEPVLAQLKEEGAIKEVDLPISGKGGRPGTMYEYIGRR